MLSDNSLPVHPWLMECKDGNLWPEMRLARHAFDLGTQMAGVPA
jgi:hypothetical protein